MMPQDNKGVPKSTLDDVQRSGEVQAYATANGLSEEEAKAKIIQMYNDSWRDTEREKPLEKGSVLSTSERDRLLFPMKQKHPNMVKKRKKNNFRSRYILARSLAVRYQTIFSMALAYARQLQLRKRPRRQILPAEISSSNTAKDMPIDNTHKKEQ